MILRMQQNNNQICACEEHIDLAFDDFLVNNETFPLLTKIVDEKCNYCEKEAIYALKISDNKGVI